MNEIVIKEVADIKGLIMTARGFQVLLDSDVAMLYGYETKKINQAAARNLDRFPEHFRFMLTPEEYDNILSARTQFSKSQLLRSQIVTLKRGQHRKYAPYVYTEQGIAMLSGILKNETAVKVSIGIMDAFVDMRRFILTYANAFERIVAVEHRLTEHDEKFDEVFDSIQTISTQEFEQGVFHKGQIYDAFKLIADVFQSAKKSIVVIDNYADDTVLDMLAKKKKAVSVDIVTNAPKRISALSAEKFNSQYSPLRIVKSDEFHDRFIVIDGSKLYHFGASLKDAGKKCFAVSVIEDKEFLTLVKSMLNLTRKLTLIEV
jgi:hypothetical protein